MATNISIIKTTDPRTGKTYAFRGSGDNKVMMEKVAAQMERDYQKTLPVELRDVVNQSTDFKCPHCKTHEQPTSRKERFTAGFLFVRTWLENVYKCSVCHREFTSEELSRAKKTVMDSNYRAALMEKYKDGEITEEVLQSAIQETI